MNVPNVPIDLAQALFLELQNAPYRQWVEARRLAPSASRSGQARQGLFRPDTLALPSSAHVTHMTRILAPVMQHVK
jgi:hypothetical protein